MKIKKTSRNELVDEASKDIIRKTYLSLYIKGFLLNFINIGVLGFWLAIIITWGPKLDLVPSRIFVFFLSVICTYLLVDIGKILLAKQLRSKLTVKNIMKIKQGISVILMIFGMALLLQGWFPDLFKEAIKEAEKKEIIK